MLPIICHFQDSKKNWQKCGNSVFADLAIFSFHPVKHIACGEGGMVTTNDEKLYKKLMMLRTHGITKDPTMLESESPGGWYYEMQKLGYNYRMPDMLCALGISQLSRAAVNLQRRHEIADRYDKELADLPLKLPVRSGNVSHAFHLYVIQTEKRKQLYDFLQTKNILPQVHYIPVTDLPYYRSLGFNSENIPVAKSYYERCLSIPMFHSMTEEEQSRVISCIREFFNGQ